MALRYSTVSSSTTKLDTTHVSVANSSLELVTFTPAQNISQSSVFTSIKQSMKQYRANIVNFFYRPVNTQKLVYQHMCPFDLYVYQKQTSCSWKDKVISIAISNTAKQLVIIAQELKNWNLDTKSKQQWEQLHSQISDAIRLSTNALHFVPTASPPKKPTFFATIFNWMYMHIVQIVVTVLIVIFLVEKTRMFDVFKVKNIPFDKIFLADLSILLGIVITWFIRLPFILICWNSVFIVITVFPFIGSKERNKNELISMGAILSLIHVYLVSFCDWLFIFSFYMFFVIAVIVTGFEPYLEHRPKEQYQFNIQSRVEKLRGLVEIMKK